MGTIRYIEHTADAGVEITAASREELFVLGARALYQLTLDYDALGCEREARVELAAAGFADLFHEWLSELLYIFDARGLAFKKFALDFDADGTKVSATMLGEEVDYERHGVHGEIKNVTYADFTVEPGDDGGFVARVIFDL